MIKSIFKFPIEDKARIRFCLRINSFVIIFGLVICAICADSSLIHFGPHKDLYIIGVNIDTWPKFEGLSFFIILIQISLLFTEDLAIPVIEFTVYNRECSHIDDFSRSEMFFYSIAVYVTKAILKGLKFFLMTEGLDMIIILFLAEELTTVYTIFLLLESKTFNETHHLQKLESNHISNFFLNFF